MKASIERALLAAGLTTALAAASIAPAADSAEGAAMVSEKIQSLRSGCAQGRTQIMLTLEELNRLLAPGVELRPQFERFKAELGKLEQQAATARERATMMKEKGESFFGDWEEKIRSIQNEDIRKEAANRLAKRKKSYDRIIATMQDAKQELVPLLADLNDIRTLLDGELSATSVASTKSLIRKATYHGTDAKESLMDVEQELDRVTAELATYK
jgi:chromosome segregation ATPase